MRAVAVKPLDRFRDLIELTRALEGGAAVPRTPLKPRPLIEQNPVRFWQGLSLVLLIALVAAIAI